LRRVGFEIVNGRLVPNANVGQYDETVRRPPPTLLELAQRA
jgi:hypothetical protein